MDFKLDIKNLEETVTKFNQLVTVVNKEKTNAESTDLSIKTDLGNGKAKDEFSVKFDEWKKNMDSYIENVTFMRDTLRDEILPKAKSLNTRSLGFAGLIGGSESIAGGKNILSLDNCNSNQVLNLLNLCSKDIYESELSELYIIDEELSKLKFTSFLSGGEISDCRSQIKDIQGKMMDFYESLYEYNRGIDELQETMVSAISSIKSLEHVQKIIDSRFINEKTADLIRSMEGYFSI